MPAERYYIQSPLYEGEEKELEGLEFHHLAHVMRGRRGETVELINGNGILAQALIERIEKKKAILKIESVKHFSRPPCRLILAQALPKQNRLDLILEKGTELGVDVFWLFPGQLSTNKECYPNQFERARLLTIAAMKQCGRLYLPDITLRPAIREWENLNGIVAFYGDLDPQAPYFETAWQNQNVTTESTVFITGPEGGISQEEEMTLRKLGAIGVKLHSNILRTETASLMAIALMSHWLHISLPF